MKTQPNDYKNFSGPHNGNGLRPFNTGLWTKAALWLAAWVVRLTPIGWILSTSTRVSKHLERYARRRDVTEQGVFWWSHDLLPVKRALCMQVAKSLSVWVNRLVYRGIPTKYWIFTTDSLKMASERKPKKEKEIVYEVDAHMKGKSSIFSLMSASFRAFLAWAAKMSRST